MEDLKQRHDLRTIPFICDWDAPIEAEKWRIYWDGMCHINDELQDSELEAEQRYNELMQPLDMGDWVCFDAIIAANDYSYQFLQSSVAYFVAMPEK